MSDEGLVDILLVRLGRNEEKERVKSLLIKELGFSEEKAAEAVAKTPNMIQKAVPMGKGRVIQNRLYPYIDLLPRMDLVDEEPEEAEAPEPAAETATEPAAEEEAPEEEDESRVEEDVSGLQTAAGAVVDAGFAEEDTGGGEPEEEGPGTGAEPEPDDEPDLEIESGSAYTAPSSESEEPGEEESEGMVVTSAAEEMRQIERCHICGRTPTDGERLAPCRSCGELTCRDCFDRVAHVCEKCAEDGKFVDRPPQPKKEAVERASAPAARRQPAPPAASSGPGGYNKGLVAGLAAALVVVVLLAVAYFVDPLGMFAGDADSSPLPDDGGRRDSVAIAADTSSVDTASTAADTASADSLAAADTTSTGPVHAAGPLNLAAAELDSASALADPAPVSLLTTSGVVGLEILKDDLESLGEDLGRIVAAAAIEVDAATLFRTDSGISVLAVGILHPEEDTRRYALLRGLGHYLASTGVNELVFYYRENQYYDARVVTYVNSNFENLSQATGPMEFQELTGCTSAQQWELLNGEVRAWITSITR